MLGVFPGEQAQIVNFQRFPQAVSQQSRCMKDWQPASPGLLSSFFNNPLSPLLLFRRDGCRGHQRA